MRLMCQNTHVSRGEASTNRLEHAIDSEDLVHVSVRWQQPLAAEPASASETSSTLARSALADDATTLDDDATWAMGVARIAQIAQGLGRKLELASLEESLEPIAGDIPARQELLTLLPKLEARLR